MKVVGYQRVVFTPKDSDKEIRGFSIILLTPYAKGKGEGYVAEKIFMTDDKLDFCAYAPKLDDEVRVTYNKYGKAEDITIA